MQRKSRTSLIKRFLESGQDVCIVPLTEGETPKHVYNAIFYSIRRNPYWALRLEVFVRKGRVFLARL